MKRIIASLIAVLLCINTIVFAEEQVSKSELINYGLDYIPERFYSSRKIECKPLDISGQANMGFADDVAGDGKGGWTDQGPTNDMASFKLFGSQTFWNIPFNIINPDNNNGKSCIILRGQNNEAFPLSAEVPVNDTGYGIYVLHSAAYGDAEKAGNYSFIYEDGTSAYFEIIGKQQIFDFWSAAETNYARTAWTGNNPSSAKITLKIFALNNPHPEKTIKSVKFESEGIGQFINIVGVTLAKELPIFPSMEVSSDSSQGVMKYSVDTWKPYIEPDEETASKSVLNMSSFLDAPAGNHGAITAKGDKFVFEDGTTAKFWGTNIVGEACFPTKEEAEVISSRLARCGYNLLRFVNFDEEELTDERLDRLSYFMKLLKDRGIYVYFSLLGNEKGDKENVSDGWKIEGIFRDELINKKIDFTKKLLNYENKYTGVKIGKDNMLVMIDMADQNSMFDFEYGLTSLNVINEDSIAELQSKFNAYLKKKYGATKNLKRVWKDVLPYEKIEDSSVVINGNWRYGIFDKNRKKDVVEFFMKLQEDYYNKLNSVIKNCGCKAVVSGFTSKWNNMLPLNTLSNSKTDFVPVNAMFSMGIDRYSAWPYLTTLKDNLIYVDIDSTVSSDGHDGKILTDVFKNRVSGKPFVISEWGAANISKLYVENSLVMAAISAQQGWTPIQYCFIYGSITKDKISDAYSTYNNPVTLGMSYAAASLYYSMNELNNEKTVNQNVGDLYDNKVNSLTIFDYISSRTSNTFTKKASEKEKADNSDYVIDAGGIHWDMLDGVFFAETDKVIAFSGNVKQKEVIDCLEFDIYSSEIALALVSLDDNKPKDSNHLLLSVSCDSANKGTVYRSKYLIEKIGDKGIVHSMITGPIGITSKSDLKVYCLNSDGTRKAELETERIGDKTTFYLTGEMNYEIVGGENIE